MIPVVGIAPDRVLGGVGSIHDLALENVSDGFALYDSGDRLIQCSSGYKKLMSSEDIEHLLPGVSFEWIAQNLIDHGCFITNAESVESCLEDWLARHRNLDEPYFFKRRDGRLIRTSGQRTGDGGIIAVCSDLTQFERAIVASGQEARKFEHYYNAAPIALWEEDWSGLKIRIDQLRNAGVTDFRAYLKDNPSVQLELVKEIKWKDFNGAAVDLYRAKNRHALQQYLAPAPATAFAAYPEVIMTFLEGRRQIGINTTDRATDGTTLNIIETFQLPKEYERDWSSVMSSSQDIANLKYAAGALNLDDGMIHESDVERAGATVSRLERSGTIGKLLDIKSAQAAMFETVLDTLATAVFLTSADLRIVHANTAGREMFSRGDPVRSGGGLLIARSPSVAKALAAAVAQAAGNEAEIDRQCHSIPAPRADGSPNVLYVLPLTRGVFRPGPAQRAVAAIFVTPGAAPLASPIEALAVLFDLTRTEASVFSKIAAGLTTQEVASSLGIEPSTIKTHLSHIFAKTGTRRQSDLMRLAHSFALKL